MCLTVLVLLCVSQVRAADRDRLVYGFVLNDLTRKNVTGCKVIKLSLDSTAIDTATVDEGNTIGSIRGCYALKVSGEGGDYLLRFEAEGYDTLTQRVHIPPFGKRNLLYHLPDVRLKRHKADVMLSGAVVKATKIKFYNRGDTIVYNADAFNLADGSMLDALIRQLPGAELREGGQIYINGQKVENLLLNGRDFFNKNNELMLDNLPAYAVKDVQVYRKQTKRSEALGHDLDQRELSMNVRLKKEYNAGWLVNVQAGSGSKERYLARFFALRTTDHSSVSLFGSANNLSDTREPGQETSWTPEKMPSGRMATRLLGGTYSIGDRQSTYTLTGDAQLLHTDEDVLSSTTGENFLTRGNTYQCGEETGRSQETQFNTSHKWSLKSKSFVWNSVNLDFDYHHWRRAADAASATFSQSPFSYGSALLDSIRRPQAGSLLRRLAINRQLSQSLSRGHSYDFSINPQISFKGFADDVILLTASTELTGRSEDAFSNLLYDYPQTPAQTTDFRRQYRSLGEYSQKYWGAFTYAFVFLNKSTLANTIIIGHDRKTTTNPLYRLDSLDGWGADDAHAIGELPSAAAYRLRCTDVQNSLWRHDVSTSEKLQTSYNQSFSMDAKGKYKSLYAQLELTLSQQKMGYRRASYDGTRHRNLLYLDATAVYQYQWDKYQRNWGFSYNGSYEPSDMASEIDLVNSADPLNLYYGAPGLKGSYNHMLVTSLSANIKRTQLAWTAALSYNIKTNAQAYGYLYNYSTGVHAYKPDNVNGNYQLTASFKWERPLDKPKRLTFKTHSYAQYGQSVDLIGTTTVDDAGWSGIARSTVHTTNLVEKLDLQYKLKQTTVSATGRAEWTQAQSRREGFAGEHVWDFSYGLTATTTLPWDLQLSTDLLMYSRRGYDNPASNTNDLVWNARLAKRLMHGRVTLAVDGFDILGQLSNITQTMNGQGRYETYRNTLPRYVMAHLTYHFTLKGKRDRREQKQSLASK